MTDDSAMMSIDFITGFTIFLVAFIWVASMVPGLYIGLKAHTVDFDAVAYRTSVILAEDPGAAGSSASGSWEVQPDNRDIVRFGLARSRDVPQILDERKVERFFCTTAFSYPDDYRERVIFGDFPYRFNISIREPGRDGLRSIGEAIPESYGYIRRNVKIRHAANATINGTMIQARGYNNTEPVRFSEFAIQFDNKRLLDGEISSPAYQINYQTDRITVNITDIKVTRSPAWPLPDEPEHPNSTLSAIRFYQRPYAGTSLASWPPVKKYQNFTFIDENVSAAVLPFKVRNNISLIFEPGFFATMDPTATMFINLTFELDPPQQFLNNSLMTPFDYNHMPANVTQPYLTDGVLEVAVW